MDNTPETNSRSSLRVPPPPSPPVTESAGATPEKQCTVGDATAATPTATADTATDPTRAGCDRSTTLPARSPSGSLSNQAGLAAVSTPPSSPRQNSAHSSARERVDALLQSVERATDLAASVGSAAPLSGSRGASATGVGASGSAAWEAHTEARAAGQVFTPERLASRLPTERSDGQNVSSTSALRYGGAEEDEDVATTMAGGNARITPVLGPVGGESGSGIRQRRSGSSPRVLVDPITVPSSSGGLRASLSASAGHHTHQQRALIQYSASAVRGGSSSMSEYAAVAGHSEVRAMLVSAEREVADVRDECARRGMRIDNLSTTLDRERANTQALREHYTSELEATKAEHEAQVRQLREQIRVLKLVSEGAMADKVKSSEDAERRKKELLVLLDRERQEKSTIMAEYREQTEALIAEQGREITSLRGTLNKVKEEYDRLSADHQIVGDERVSLGDQLTAIQLQIEKERLEGSRSLKDVQSRLLAEKEQLQEQLSIAQEEHAREGARQAGRYQDLAEQLHRHQDQSQLLEAQLQNTIDELKHTYRRDSDKYRRDLEEAQARAERMVEEHRREVEKVSRAEEKTVTMLRQALEEVRAEKDSAAVEAFQQREALQVQHRAKVAQMQTTMESVAAELNQERTSRRDVEAELEVCVARAENYNKTIQSLTTELEASHADQRLRERAAEQTHQATLEELRTKVRTTTTELTYTQQQQHQQAIEQQKLRDELAMKVTALDHTRNEHQRIEAQLAAQLTKQQEASAAREVELSKAVEQLRAQKGQLEVEKHRLERGAQEGEARLIGMTKQVEQERAALEVASRQLQESKALVDDLQRDLGKERGVTADLGEERRALERSLQESQLYGSELEGAVQMAERRLQEYQQDQARQNKMYEGKLTDLDQRHKAEVAALRMSIEQLRGDVGRAKEAVLSKEATLQLHREEAGQRHRESMMRETALQEGLDDLRAEHDAEMVRMDEVLNSLRSDLHKTQTMCTEYERELSHTHRNAEGRKSDLEIALEQSETARVKLLDDAKYREQLNQELQGTVRLLTARLNANEDDVRRMQEELADTNKKIQDAHTLIGRKDASIGQLNAKLRAYEARNGSL